MPVYLDCNATTPLDPRVQDAVIEFLRIEYGNAGSRTHVFGARAKEAVQRSREQVAAVVGARVEEVIFTSGATESNNLAIIGLAAHGLETGKRHIVTTEIEHKAVLEPIQELEHRGFSVTLIPPTNGGWIDAAAVTAAVRDETLLVSVMQANNETGVLQPISDIARRLEGHPAYFHVDAAQGFGKDIAPLQDTRIDLISISAHKIYGPKGVGALVVRRRGYERVPLAPLLYGGGQERGLRPGTLPVPLVVGFGLASELALNEYEFRAVACRRFRNRAIAALARLAPVYNGDSTRTLPHAINITLPGLDSEAVMLALKDVVAISNGSACTSQSYQPSHVLKSMGLPESRIMGALRISWCHMTQDPDWDEIVSRTEALR